MRRDINNVVSSAVVTALAIALKINVCAVVIRGWVVPPHIRMTDSRRSLALPPTCHKLFAIVLPLSSASLPGPEPSRNTLAGALGRGEWNAAEHQQRA